MRIDTLLPNEVSFIFYGIHRYLKVRTEGGRCILGNMSLLGSDHSFFVLHVAADSYEKKIPIFVFLLFVKEPPALLCRALTFCDQRFWRVMVTKLKQGLSLIVFLF